MNQYIERYSQGIASDGAVILCDGQPMTPEQILMELNHPYTSLDHVIAWAYGVISDQGSDIPTLVTKELLTAISILECHLAKDD